MTTLTAKTVGLSTHFLKTSTFPLTDQQSTLDFDHDVEIAALSVKKPANGTLVLQQRLHREADWVTLADFDLGALDTEQTMIGFAYIPAKSDGAIRIVPTGITGTLEVAIAYRSLAGRGR